MERNLKKIGGRHLVSFFLIISIISSSFLPIFATKARAQFGGIVHDPIISAIIATDKAYRFGKDKFDSVAMAAARVAIQKIVASTVNWANSGFEGNPAYATDPKQYFTDLGDGIAGNFIGASTSPLSFLCSPFQAQIRLALRANYIPDTPFQCTLTGAVKNIEAFYNDFSQGGWDGWFSMTQNNANNPYGAYLSAKIELDSRLAKAIGLEQNQLDWNQGFLSWSDCTANNPPMWIEVDTPLGKSRQVNPAHVAGKADGECTQRGPTKTPGSVIKGQLDKVLPSGLESLITVNHVEQLVQAFATGLLAKYVFGPKGLFSKQPSLPITNPGSSIPGSSTGGTGDQGQPGIDNDGDGIPDGLDTDGDGQLDVCYYGGPPCVDSSAANPSGLSSSLLGDLQAERAKYGTTMTPDEIGKLLNAVAWNNQAAGWGLSSKTSGSTCTSPAGNIACDILIQKSTNTWVDVFLGDDLETPQWNIIEPNTDPSRQWVAPAPPSPGAVIANPLNRDYVKQELTKQYAKWGLTPTGPGTGPTDIDYYVGVIIQTGGWTSNTARGENNIGYWTDRIKNDLVMAGVYFTP